jgi:polysaccharide deacetylase family protein (PEP-CTERM system associated)
MKGVAADHFGGPEESSLLLSVDFEDWHQLVRRAAGVPDWDVADSALERQTTALLDLLDELGARATFFFLGITARRYPGLVREVIARGHEPGCHGFAHERVYKQQRAAFEEDVAASADLIGETCGRRPISYRAPAFSINRDTTWAFEALAELGFRFDSSLYDSPRIPNRIAGIPDAPCRLELPSGAELWELPVCVARFAGRALPIGGGSYWRLLPAAAIIRGLRRAQETNPYPVVYVHPYEFDPQPLRARLAHAPSLGSRLYAARRSVWRNAGRALVAKRLRAVAGEFRLISYEQAYEDIVDLEHHPARSRALSREGVVV